MKTSQEPARFYDLNVYTVLTLIFVTLKLTGFITWSWWWVFVPIWGQFLIWFALTFILVIVKWCSRG